MDDESARPESEPDQPRPFQFSIGSLIIIMAEIAVLLAVATQASLDTALLVVPILIHLYFLVHTLRNPKYWRGITALNITVFNCFTLACYCALEFLGLNEYTFTALWLGSPFVYFGFYRFQIVPLASSERFNKDSAKVCLVLQIVYFVFLFLLFLTASSGGWK